MTDKKHEQQLRLKAIELIAYWEGRLVTNRLMSWFGISRQQASNDIKRYLLEHNPQSLAHVPGVKAYLPCSTFMPKLTNGSVDEYLALIRTFNDQAIATTAEPEVHFAAIQMPDRSVRPEIVREVLKACRTNSSIKILYASMSKPTWKERIISPHTLVFTGFWWHVRAYCHSRNGFRDFLLSRIDRTPRQAEAISQTQQNDKLWNEKITFNFIPNPNLSDSQKLLVEKDYGMPDGRLEITVRKALAHYTIQRYRVATTVEEEANPFKHPLTIMSADKNKLSLIMSGEQLQGIDETL